MKLALPVIIAQAGQLTTQFADTAMVGQYGGENPIPLAAVSLGSSLFLLIYLAAMGLAMSITPLVGEHYARGERRKVGHLFQNGMVYSIAIGVVATAAAVALRPFIGVLGEWMSSPGQSVEEVAAMALPYYDMLAWSIIPLMLFLGIIIWHITYYITNVTAKDFTHFLQGGSVESFPVGQLRKRTC